MRVFKIVLLAFFIISSLEATKPQANHLIKESSPYLLQHAYNPIDWYAWDKEAFDKAKRENKLIFLSIGYSTCHWCHVMAHESFENDEVAKLFNQHFVSIKVDREEYPDVDNFYMQSIIAMTGHGGWPLNVFLTPESKPILGGSYFSRQKLKKIAQKLTTLWDKSPKKVRANASYLDTMVKGMLEQKSSPIEVTQQDIDRAVESIEVQFDPLYGGFGQNMKFPNESYLSLLLERQLQSPAKTRQNILDRSLRAMAYGGIYDQIGGGFHRYAVDREWRVPHFEKMLYNQALLSKIYTQAYQLNNSKLYKYIVEQTLAFTLHTMRSPNNTFYAAMDADTEGKEGSYYLWSVSDIEELQDASLLKELYHIDNLYEIEGGNILYKSSDNIEYKQLEKINNTLLTLRKKRTLPHRDKKIITAWNAMMIDSLALASELLDREDFLDAALLTAEELWQKSRRSDGRLYRILPSKERTILAVQEDYAYLAQAYLRLYDVTMDNIWLERTKELTDEMTKLFWDEKDGGYFISEASDLIKERSKQSKDGEIPSANAIALTLLEDLYHRSGEVRYRNLAKELLKSFSNKMLHHPQAHAYLFLGADRVINQQYGSTQYASKGAIRLQGKFIDASTLKVSIDLKEGWHINSNQPLESYLSPTSVTSEDKNWKIKSIKYPEGREKKLAYSQTALSLYEKHIEILLEVEPINSREKISIDIYFQACSDELCEAKQKRTLAIFQNKN